MIGQFKILEPCWYFKLGDKYYHVVARDFFRYDYTFSSVSAGGESGKTTLDNLEPEKGEVYVFTLGVFQKGIEVEVYQPPATGRFGVKNYVASIDYELSPAEDPNQCIMLVSTYGKSVAFNVKNNLEVAIQPKLRFVGYKYMVEEVTDPAKIKELERMFKEGKLPELATKYKG